jgi:YD repeat-containing protein
LKRIPALALLVLSLAAAKAGAAEDRTEVIEGAKGRRELDYRNDVLAEERSYDAGGGILEERHFGPDALPVDTMRYLREGGRLVGVEDRDASGSVVGSLAYRYDREGRLLGLSAEGSLGEGSVGMLSAGGAPKGSWTEAGANTTVLGYDASGRAVVIETMKDGKVVSIERRSYGEDGILSSVEVEDRASGSSSELAYDEKGRQSLRRETSAKGAETRTQYRYDDAGRLVEELGRSGIHSTSVRRSYAEDGSLLRVETRRDGELLLAVEYSGEGRVEELYEDGELFVKASYAGGRKIRDEFYSAGVLLRSRDYQ